MTTFSRFMATLNRLMRPLKVSFALIGTPWMIFISTSSSLFLNNQQEISFDTSIMAPFFGILFVFTLIGALIYKLSSKYTLFMLILYFYLSFGLLFFIFDAGRELFLFFNENDSYLLVVVSFFCALAIFIQVKAGSGVSITFFSFISICVIISDLAFTALNYESVSKRDLHTSNNGLLVTDSCRAAGAMPNVYHILLDGYQADLFEATADKELLDLLSGFTFFENTTTVSGRTRIAIPAIFSGKSWNGELPLTDFTQQAMNSNASMLSRLAQAEYVTTAYLHKRFDFAPNLFDEVILYHHLSNEWKWLDRNFVKLWVYRYMPMLLSTYLIRDPRVIERIETGRLASDSIPILSYSVYEQFKERELRPNVCNRYIFLHLILPHPPYRLGETCEVGDSSPIKQFLCANHLIEDFLISLGAVGQLDESLVVIHADHGLDLDPTGTPLKGGETNQHKLHELRSRALLLYKPISGNREEPLRTSDRITSILDLAPTILSDLKLQPLEGFEGISLHAQTSPDRAIEYYYVLGNRYDKVQRYTYQDGRFVFEGTLGGGSQ